MLMSKVCYYNVFFMFYVLCFKSVIIGPFIGRRVPAQRKVPVLTVLRIFPILLHRNFPVLSSVSGVHKIL